MSWHIDVPSLAQSKLTDDVLRKIDIMMRSIAATSNIGQVERELNEETGLPAGSQRRWKSDLRKLYNLEARTSDLSSLCTHPQIRQALAYVLMRKSPSNAGEMRSAKNLLIISPTSGQIFAVEEFITALYAHEGHNAKTCYLALMTASKEKRLLFEGNHELVALEQVPGESSVGRFLRNQSREHTSRGHALRISRMSRAERTARDIFISRPKDEYAPGELLEGDHTEDITMIYRNDGKAAPRWWTVLVDFRTGVCAGYALSYRANSDTIALAYKRACLGTQLEVAVIENGEVVYRPSAVKMVPRILRYDNGKDYRSKQTGASIGNIDFNDEARKCVQLISEIRHTGKRHPQAKGTVEGWFAIIQKIKKYLPGYKGSNYSKKPDALKSQIDAGILLTEEEDDQLTRLAINVLNNRPRQSLGGLSPMQFTLANQGQPRVVDEMALNLLQMKFKKDVKIVRGYVRMSGGSYFSMDLDGLSGEYAQLYYDPQEIGRVAVYINGEFKAFAVDKDLLGASEKDWIRVMKERTAKNRDIAQEIHDLRQGITLEEAKAMLFHAEINNIVTVDAAALQKRTPAIVTLMGIESKAKELHEELEKQKRIEETHKKVATAKNPLSLIDMSKIR